MHSTRPWLDDIIIGLSYYFFTSLIVVLGVMFGREFVKPPPHAPSQPPDLLACFANWDGQAYKAIAERGYFYDPERRSTVAYFPAYPLLGRLVLQITGLRTEAALLIVSHAFLAGAFMLLRTYARLRFPDAGPSMWDNTLLAFGVFPTTFFFRMTYTESMFFFLAVAALLGMERKWPLLLIALTCGLATATRPVGVALTLPFLLNLWQRSDTWRAFAWQSTLLLPICAWGILVYMAYQDAAFGEPLAFAKSQDYWSMTFLAETPPKLESLLTLEPIWGIFDPNSPRYWSKYEVHDNPLFSMWLANPLLFGLAVFLVVIGAAKGWTTSSELALALGLLLIPYVTRAHEMSMASAGRFIVVVPSVYLTLGQVLSRMSTPLVTALLAFSIFVTVAYAALFAAQYFVL